MSLAPGDVAPGSDTLSPHHGPDSVNYMLEHSNNFAEALKSLRSSLPECKPTAWTSEGCGSGEFETPQASNHRHLVLNMDINKTILMRDSVSKKNLKDIVNEILADVCWGVEIDGQWVAIVSEPSVHRAAQKDDVGEVVSYFKFLEIKNPGSKNKQLRNKMLAAFTDEGEPGASFLEQSLALQRGLKLPDGTPVQLIPAFFELLLSLKRNKRSFTLCFRTFGEDMQSVVDELNCFCEGRHPLYPDSRMDGSDGEPDYRVRSGDAEQCGTFYRDDDTVAIAMGTWESPEREKEPSLSFYEKIEGATVHAGTIESTYLFLKEKCGRPGSMALRDYHPYWKSKEYDSNAGKLLFYDLSPGADVHFMFFDDNIRYKTSYIVDARHARKDCKVPLIGSLMQSHMCRAEPLESIGDTGYFVKQVARLEAGYDRLVEEDTQSATNGRIRSL